MKLVTYINSSSLRKNDTSQSLFQRLRLIPVALVLALSPLFLGACANDDEDVYVENSVDTIYNEAQDLMVDEKYKTAAKRFDEVERQHPYSKWATKAQLMSGYAYYMANQYDDAVISLDRFIQLHPSNKDVPYALYLKALCYYEQISTVERDQEMTANATKTLNVLITRYPASKYARDAGLKLDLTFDHLAGKEMAIGRYYQGQGQYLASLNRFKVVIERYQTTTHVPEALLRMTESYLAIGLTEEAQKSASVLGHNFPGSEWYVDAYELVEGVTIRIEDIEEPWYKVW